MNSKKLRTPLRVSLVLAAFLVVCGMAMAQNDQVKGVINGRSGATMSVLSQGGESITVVLTPDHASVGTRRAFSQEASEHDRAGTGTGGGSQGGVQR
jgi:hypothetical protein